MIYRLFDLQKKKKTQRFRCVYKLHDHVFAVTAAAARAPSYNSVRKYE